MRSSHKNQFDERKNNWLVQKFELRVASTAWRDSDQNLISSSSLKKKQNDRGSARSIGYVLKHHVQTLLRPLQVSPVSEISPYL